MRWTSARVLPQVQDCGYQHYEVCINDRYELGYRSQNKYYVRHVSDGSMQINSTEALCRIMNVIISLRPS